MIGMGRRGRSPALHQLEVDHLRRVGGARAELEDAGVATRAVLVARRDLLEELVDHVLGGVLERRGRLAARVQVALARERDQLLDLRLDRLGLGLGGLDPLVVDDLDAEVGEQRLAMGAVAGELVTRLLMAHGVLVRPESQAALREGLDDLVDRLLAEVRDGGELALRLRHEVADRLDTGALEAVVGTDAELELLEEDVVHRAAAALPARLRQPMASAGAVVEPDRARARPEVLDAVLVGEDREARDQDLGSLTQRRLRVDRPVGLDVERELVEVRALADASLLDGVRDAADRAEDRVDRDDADRLVGRLVLLRRAVAAAAADREVELELGLLVERRDVDVGVEDLDAGGQVDVLRVDLAGAGDDQRRLDLGRVGVHPADDALEVEDDVGHVFGDALDRRELVRDAFDPDGRDGGAGQRAEQHAAQGVSEGVAEAAVERLAGERAAIVLHLFGGDAGDLEVEHRRGPDCRIKRAARGGWQGAGAFRVCLGYLEYRSKNSRSCTGVVISRPSGLRRPLGVSASWSPCRHAGTWAVSSVASRMSSTAPVSAALTAMMSPSRTW